MNKCKECNTETENPKFCSRSCSVTYNNRNRCRHRTLSKICPDCGGRKTSDAIRCHKCKVKHTIEKNMAKPISSFFRKKGHRSYRYDKIRQWAKKLSDYWEIPKKCFCGYDLHVELCHKVPISWFKDDTPMGIVNSEENLKYLCPNHHWEYDITPHKPLTSIRKYLKDDLKFYISF